MPSMQIPEKLTPFLEPHRYKVAYGGRGGAKSWSVAELLLAEALNEPLRIMCTREIQASMKDSVHQLLVDRIQAMGIGHHFTITDNYISSTNGSRFTFRGLKGVSAEGLKSFEGADRCWVEEAQTVSDASFKLLIPTIRKERSQILVTFNPRFPTDAVWKRFVLNKPTDSAVVKINWRDNPWFSSVLRQELEDQKELDYEDYLHIWEGELRQYAEGAIYAQQLKKVLAEGRLCALPVDSAAEVHTAWDLGKDDATAIWFFQQVGPWVHFIDYHEDSQKEIGDYAEVIKAKAKDRGFTYGYHYMPHDVDIDVLGMQDNRMAQFEAAGVTPIEVVPRIRILQEGIQATKRRLAYCRFDEEHCADGWSALANYRRSLNEHTQKFSDEPVHDWASHGSDSFRMFAQGFSSMSNPVPEQEQISDRRRRAMRRNNAQMGSRRRGLV